MNLARVARPSAALRLTLLAVALLLVTVHAAPVAAYSPPVGKVRYWIYGDCRNDGAYYNPRGRVYMVEYGKHHVTRFKAKFKLYRSDETGIHLPKLEKSYRTASFPNDAQSYGGYLPSNTDHAWTDVYGTNTYQLDVKMTWERPWRPDWNKQVYVTSCAGI